MGFRQIGHILDINYVTVYKWIRKWSSSSLPYTSVPVKVVELDELHTYVGDKKTTNGYGLLLIYLVSGLSILSVETELQPQD